MSTVGACKGGSAMVLPTNGTYASSPGPSSCGGVLLCLGQLDELNAPVSACPSKLAAAVPDPLRCNHQSFYRRILEELKRPEAPPGP